MSKQESDNLKVESRLKKKIYIEKIRKQNENEKGLTKNDILSLDIPGTISKWLEEGCVKMIVDEIIKLDVKEYPYIRYITNDNLARGGGRIAFIAPDFIWLLGKNFFGYAVQIKNIREGYVDFRKPIPEDDEEIQLLIKEIYEKLDPDLFNSIEKLYEYISSLTDLKINIRRKIRRKHVKYFQKIRKQLLKEELIKEEELNKLNNVKISKNKKIHERIIKSLSRSSQKREKQNKRFIKHISKNNI